MGAAMNVVDASTSPLFVCAPDSPGMLIAATSTLTSDSYYFTENEDNFLRHGDAYIGQMKSTMGGGTHDDISKSEGGRIARKQHALLVYATNMLGRVPNAMSLVIPTGSTRICRRRAPWWTVYSLVDVPAMGVARVVHDQADADHGCAQQCVVSPHHMSFTTSANTAVCGVFATSRHAIHLENNAPPNMPGTLECKRGAICITTKKINHPKLWLRSC